VRTAEQIVDIYRQRKDGRGPLINRAAEVAATYDGVVQVPLPELDQNEQAAVANLLRQGLDQLAMRVASVTPNVVCPPLIPGQKKAEENARIRARAITAWWQENRFDRKQRKRARWLLGYASAPVMIRPDRKRQIPVWELRDPLATFAAPMPEADEMCPTDCIFAVKRTWQWIYDRWPTQARMLDARTSPDPDEMWEVLEYVDSEEFVIVAVGKPRAPEQKPWGSRPVPQGAPCAELERYPNLIGRSTVVVPSTISLTHSQGLFDGIPGMHKLQARLLASNVISVEKAIWPDVWFVSRPNETVQVVERPDGRAGVPGLVKGGDLKEVTLAPSPLGMQMVDYIERSQRVTASIPSDFGGEAPTNVRTGRAGEQLLKSTVDFPVQEAQEILGMAYQEENRLAVETAKAFFGGTGRSFYVNWKGKKGTVDYTPNVNFDQTANIVSFPHAGSDVNSLIIGIGQRIGLKEMSIRTAQELDPFIDDPEREYERITGESLDSALLASIDQAAASGQLGPLEISRLRTYIMQNKMDLSDAFEKLHNETQQTQAAATAPQPGEPGAGPGGAPPGPPGLMAPGIQETLGVGPNNPPGQVPTPSPGLQHMSQLLGALRQRKMG
jgi:hypothetical protein